MALDPFGMRSGRWSVAGRDRREIKRVISVERTTIELRGREVARDARGFELVEASLETESPGTSHLLPESAPNRNSPDRRAGPMHRDAAERA